MTSTDPGKLWSPRWLIEAFVVSNLAFLAVDIWMAHAINDFAHPAEWVPFGFSLAATIALAPLVALGRSLGKGGRRLGVVVGACSILVGVAGLLLHLEGAFFADQTLKNLVYTAPFAAPLSYAGIGFVLLVNRMERDPATWARWLVFFALGGFVGNFALSLLDHAQNGFFQWTEWIPVGAAAFAVSFLAVAVVRHRDHTLLVACLLLMAAEVAVGVLGFLLHLASDLAGPSSSARDNFIYGAPIFAPMLFADIAVLGALGLWFLRKATDSRFVQKES